MDRKDLIRLYLEAETTSEQERELYASFVSSPPRDDEEMAVFQILQAVMPVTIHELPEAEDEFDRIVKRSRTRSYRTWCFAFAGVAAAVAAVIILTRKPAVPETPATTPEEYAVLIQQLNFISNFNPAEADSFEFKPVGDGFVMTAHFPDGQTASFIVTPLDGGKSFNLVSLND
ncbi:MAG: hypothetical protein J5490_06570 [Bacteroidales bacterium]|nr:hypothetical protein [Bacteroidales bacterium]